jgi:hypothetical protein
MKIVKNVVENVKKLLSSFKNILFKYFQGYIEFYIFRNIYLSSNANADEDRLLNIASSVIVPH